jgi:hypothetical protein
VIASLRPSFRGADSSYSWRSFRGSRQTQNEKILAQIGPRFQRQVSGRDSDIVAACDLIIASRPSLNMLADRARDGTLFGKRLKTLKCLGLFEAIRKTGADEPGRFRYHPTHPSLGLNAKRRLNAMRRRPPHALKLITRATGGERRSPERVHDRDLRLQITRCRASGRSKGNPIGSDDTR